MTIQSPPVIRSDPWSRFLHRPKPFAFNYLFAHRPEAPEPSLLELAGPDHEFTVCRASASAIDGLRLSRTIHVLAAETAVRVPAWEALPSCLFLSAHHDNRPRPEVVFFRLEDWRRHHEFH